MKKNFTIIVLALMLQSLNSFAQIISCSVNAGSNKSYCRDSVQIGGSPSSSNNCGRSYSILYSWLPTTGLSNPNAANPWANPSATTTYTLTVIVYNATTHDTCCVKSATVTVTYLPRCSANAGTPQTICCPGGHVTIGGSPAAIDSCSGCDSTLYSWLPTTGLSNPHAANPTATPATTTTYTLHIYAYNSINHDTCCNASSTVKITVSSLCCRTADIAPITDNNNIKIYPNPTNQVFNVEINQPLVNGEVRLFDINGRAIWQKTGLKGNEKLPVDIKDIRNGVYFIEISDSGQKIYSQKVFIQQ